MEWVIVAIAVVFLLQVVAKASHKMTPDPIKKARPKPRTETRQPRSRVVEEPVDDEEFTDEEEL